MKATIDAPKMAASEPPSRLRKCLATGELPARVEHVARPVGEHARRRDDDQDAETGEEGDPPRAREEELLALGDHRPPLRRRDLGAEPDEAERREREDRVAEVG